MSADLYHFLTQSQVLVKKMAPLLTANPDQSEQAYMTIRSAGQQGACVLIGANSDIRYKLIM